MKMKNLLGLLLLLATAGHAQTPPSSGCISASSWWTQTLTVNSGGSLVPASIGASGGTVLASIAPPNTTSDTVLGLSQGVPANYPNLAAIVRFENGTIQAMSGGATSANDAYVDANPPIPYVVPPAGMYYLVTFKIDPIAQHTYSLLITPPGGTQVLLASGLKFRSGSAAVTTLDHAGGATGNGTAQVCNISVVAPPAPTTITYQGSTPYTAQGNVPFSVPMTLTGCSAATNVLNVNLTCPPLTGTAPWFSSGNVPYTVTFDFQGLPPGCVPALLPGTTTISFTGCAPIQPAINACTIASGSHSVTLSWSASTSSGVTGYNVYRGTVTGGPYTMLQASVQGLQYIDSGVTAGSTYYYVVTAVNPQGESLYSNQATAVIPATGTGTVKASIPASNSTGPTPGPNRPKKK